ncbi:MAG: class I SAM-dependent methyltransferase [Firmicutes bacterium]|nr:class I SAM-dependent methyltransferase [Bacillota bacterium]
MASIKNELVIAYNRQAATRNAAARQEWKIQVRDSFLAQVQKQPLHSLLDIGSGPGHDGKFFQENGLKVSCIDISPKMVELCIAKGLQAKVMDFSQMSFHDKSFDAVWALNCLLHVPKVELPGVLTEISRVLKPGGLFFIGVYGRYNSEGIWKDDDYQPKRFFSFFDEATLKAMLSQFFEVVSFQVFPHTDELDFHAIVVTNCKGVR